MTRTITFTDTDEGRQRFRILWDGLRFGTIVMSQKPESSRTPEVLRQETQIRKTLKTISTNGAVEGDIDVRTLQAGGGTVLLEHPLVKLLSAYGWAVQWTPTAVESAVDALDFLDSAPESND